MSSTLAVRSSFLLALTLLACGSSAGSGGGTSAGTGGTGAHAGESGGSQAGGSSGSPASGGGAGGSGGGTAGSGAGGGSGPVDVLDPSLPKPSYDCRTDSTSRTCVSISGKFNGMDLDMHCADPSSPMLGDAAPDAWLTSCRPSGMAGVGYWYQISVPWQMPGSFDLKRTTGQPRAGVDEILALDYSGVDFFTDNFVSGEVAGTVALDAGSGDTILTGTFRGTWSDPGAAHCRGEAVSACYAAQITGTFRSDQIIKFLDHP